MLLLALLAGCGSAVQRSGAYAAAEPSMTIDRRLTGEHLLSLEGRRHRVLGTRELRRESGTSETVLLLRDEVSGQIRHSRPGLQFSLRPGVDAEAFIREHPAMQRLFVNPLVVQVLVDAGQIAVQYEALRADPRVDRLNLLPLEAERTPRP